MDESRCLWKSAVSRDRDCDKIVTNGGDTYADVFSRFASKPRPKSFKCLCSNALVVVQEVCLTCFVLARHHALIRNQEGSVVDGDRLLLSTYAMLVALIVAIAYTPVNQPHQDRKTKAKQRFVDGVLLAVVLRYTASILRALTASYSSDTVQLLGVLAMAIHLVTCDYSYANGNPPVRANPMPVSRLDSQQRPPFLGGTISLNAAFFATTLLASRLDSNASAFFFVAVAIILFAFYPVTRHAISTAFPASSSCALWVITFLFVGANVLLWRDHIEWIIIFALALILLGLAVPAWESLIQHGKVLLPGPWEIVPMASMQLDYTVRSDY